MCIDNCEPLLGCCLEWSPWNDQQLRLGWWAIHHSNFRTHFWHKRAPESWRWQTVQSTICDFRRVNRYHEWDICIHLQQWHSVVHGDFESHFLLKVRSTERHPSHMLHICASLDSDRYILWSKNVRDACGVTIDILIDIGDIPRSESTRCESIGLVLKLLPLDRHDR